SAETVPQDNCGYCETESQMQHLQAVQVPAQDLGGFEQGDGDDAEREQHGGQQVNKCQQPRLLDQTSALLRKREGEVQEKRSLQQLCSHIGPEDNPIEGVQLACVMERVKDERNQAEDIKVGRLGRRPAAEQYIQPDAQIDQGNQSHALMQGVVGL